MDAEHITSDIGRKIRDLRKQNGLTQQELADRTELTKGFISQLENGQVSPSVVTLFDLIECLGTTPADFFRGSSQEPIVFAEKDSFEKVDDEGNITRWLVPSAQSNQMEPLLVQIMPHTSLPMDEPHNGEEFGYVLSGRIYLYRDDKRFEVKAGESFYYEADKTHRIENPGNRPARFLWVSTPPTF
ncbi:MAG: cupin domain-containing protein [Clostridiales bacterium]|nr:cupin domain-containing protein [Clostridiales bacterium]